MKLTTYLLILLSIQAISFAQQLQLKLGNTWIYQNENGYRIKEVITDSGVFINNNYYYKITVPPNTYGSYLRYDKNDSLYYIYYIGDNVEFPYYKENMSVGDTVHYMHPWGPSFFYVEFESIGNVFDSIVTIRWVTYDFIGLVIHDVIWTQEFGMLSMRDGVTGNVWYTLLGCVINGRAYGDTTTVGIDDYYTDKPDNYVLYQNYPNPFNPTTKIRWQSPVSGWQTIKVYDVLGNEITTLINEYKPAGSYEVEFNASNLSSGIYFYKLTAGSFVSSKKMMVIK
jgi:hypothetical protein